MWWPQGLGSKKYLFCKQQLGRENGLVGLALGTLIVWRCFPQVPPNRRQESQCRRAAPLFLWQSRLGMSSVGARLKPSKPSNEERNMQKNGEQMLAIFAIIEWNPSEFLLDVCTDPSVGALSLSLHIAYSRPSVVGTPPWFLMQTSQ